jgi:uncharacterized protein YebE (UPF0316 family)
MEHFDFFSWVIIPTLIILARVADQTIGTLRLVYLSKGYKMLAPIMGFFEVLIWIVVVSQIFQQLNNYFYYIVYALGFALGNYLGLRLEEKISLGKVVIRVFPKNKVDDIVEKLKSNGYGLTIMDASGTRGPVKIIFSIINRKSAALFISIIREFDQHTFYTIEDVRTSSDGVFPVSGKTEFRRKGLFGAIKFK